MSPSQKGRFCGSCQKQVVDFTNMTDSQVALFFKKPSAGSVCGRFMQDQLERDLEIPRKRIPWMKYFFTVALPAFLVSRSAAQETKSAIKGDTTVVVERDLSQVLMGKMAGPVIATVTQTPASINGRVLDNSGAPIAGATIMIKGTLMGTSADTAGNFLFSNVISKDIVLVASAVGYMSQEIKVDFQNNSAIIKLELQPAFMGEVIVVGMISPRKLKKRKSFSVIKELAPDSTSRFVKSFPNPVIAGDPLTIQCKKMVKGDYSFELINLGGQMVQYKEMRIENEKQSLQLDTPLVKPGTYYLKITNKATRKSITDKIVIQG